MIDRPTVRKQMSQGQDPREEASPQMSRQHLQWPKALLKASLTPPHNLTGTVVDSDIINHAEPNQSFITFGGTRCPPRRK